MNYRLISFHLIVTLFFIAAYSGLFAYPKAGNPGCNNCHDVHPHIFKKGMISVKENPLSFEISVNGLDKGKRFMMGAEIVDSEGNILQWVNHTINLPIVFEVPAPGKYLVYVGGSYNGMTLRYDSMFVETPVDNSPPEILSVFTHDGIDNEIIVEFDEPVLNNSAENITNYSLNQDVEIIDAVLKPDKKTVVLEVNLLQAGQTYLLHSGGIEDRFKNISTWKTVEFQHKGPDLTLKGYWPFDEGEGDIAHDFSGYGNDGVISNALWIDGIQGKALDFKFKGRYINAGNDPSLNIDSDFTISLWFNAEIESANYARMLLSARDTWDSMDWQLFQVKNGSIDFWFGNNGAQRLFSDKFLKPDYEQWNHIVLTRKGDLFKLWINGKIAAEANNSAAMPTGDTLRMGRLAGDDDSMWGECRMDEVRIYSRTLNETEISELYDHDILSKVYEETSVKPIMIFPNPASDHIKIVEYNYNIAQGDKPNAITIINSLGKIVIKFENITTKNNKIDVSKLPPGMYYVKVSYINYAVNRKLLIIR